MFRPALITSLCYKLVMALPNINGLGWNFPWLFFALGWMFWQQRFNHFICQRNRNSSSSVKITLWYLHSLEEDLWICQGEDLAHQRYLLHLSWKFFSFCLWWYLSISKAADHVERFTDNIFVLPQHWSNSPSTELPYMATPLNVSISKADHRGECITPLT